MSVWKKVSRGQTTKELLAELVRMWQRVGLSRAGAIHQASKDIGISGRKGKCILYDEPHLLTDLEALGAESRAEIAWRKIADQARQAAEYCEAQAELSRIRKRQGELDFGRGFEWAPSTKSLRKLAERSNAMLCAAPIGGLCAVLIG